MAGELRSRKVDPPRRCEYDHEPAGRRCRAANGDQQVCPASDLVCRKTWQVSIDLSRVIDNLWVNFTNSFMSKLVDSTDRRGIDLFHFAVCFFSIIFGAAGVITSTPLVAFFGGLIFLYGLAYFALVSL